MLPAPEFFQTAPAHQNSKTSRPSLLRNFRLPVPTILHHRLPEHLQQPRERKKKQSDKSQTNCEALQSTARSLTRARRNSAWHCPKVLYEGRRRYDKIVL